MDDATGNAAGYAMLASAVAGSRLNIARIDDAAGPVYSDGRTIFLPRSAWQHNGHLQVLVQAALIRAGSLDPKIMRQLAGRPRVARRFLYLEACRATRMLSDRLPRCLLEEPTVARVSATSNSAAQSLEIAQSTLRLPDTPKVFGSLRPLKLVFVKSAQPTGSPSAAQLSGSKSESKVDELDEQQEAEESKLLKLFSNPLASGNGPISELLKKLLGMGRQPSLDDAAQGGGGGAEMPIAGRQRAFKRGLNAVLALIPEELKFSVATPSARAHVYPEWDEFQNRYKPNWTFVEEFLPAPRDDRPLAIPSPHNSNLVEPSLAMYRSLAKLGFSHEQHQHQRMGEHINVDALVRMMIGVRTGGQIDERIYSASLRTKRDLGVLLLVDVSGSSGEGSGEVRRIHDDQVKLGYQLARTLEQLGDQVAVYGFQSWGRTAVQFLQIKTFGQRLDGVALERLSVLEPAGYTRTGAAIRHATHLLENFSGAPHKLLVLISDGFAYDDGYEGAYGEGDTRRALQEARDRQMGCVCIGVGEVESARLARVFGTASSLRVTRPEHAAAHVGTLFGAAIARANLRRARNLTDARVASDARAAAR